MNALKRWQQQKVMEAWQQVLGSFVNRPPVPWPEGQQEPLAVAEWSPLVDISEDSKQYQVKAELPEMKREDVKVAVVDGTLTISGERKLGPEEKDRKQHRLERAYGRFERSFSLPEDASPEKVTAELKDGVLKVHLAKNEQPKQQSLDIVVH
jgi:HSP20 family protein